MKLEDSLPRSQGGGECKASEGIPFPAMHGVTGNFFYILHIKILHSDALLDDNISKYVCCILT